MTSADESDAEKKVSSIKISDEILAGVYANNTHLEFTGSEYILSFILKANPQPVVVARVIISQQHKEKLAALLSQHGEEVPHE